MYNLVGDFMKIVGTIVEYNPLHNGHVLHFNKIKEQNPNLIIGCMSSTLTMRGDLSLFDKFTKTKQALNLGYDIIIELPLALSMQRADIFASNAIKLLNLMNVNEVIIGSELNDVSIYEKEYQNEKINNKVDKSMKENSSLKDLSSNDTLGYFYYKAIKDNDYNMLLTTIKREYSSFNSNILEHNSIASAKAIRANLDKLNLYTPSFVYNDKDLILDENKLFNYIKYQILSLSISELKDIFFVDEGIEYKLKDIKDYNNLNDFIDYLSGKKYTKTRMKRMLMYILFNIKKDDMNNIGNIDFIRILGFSNKGKEYINKIKKDIKIYTNIKENINNILDIELKVSKILDSIYNLNLLEKEQKGPIF